MTESTSTSLFSSAEEWLTRVDTRLAPPPYRSEASAVSLRSIRPSCGVYPGGDMGPRSGDLLDDIRASEVTEICEERDSMIVGVLTARCE